MDYNFLGVAFISEELSKKTASMVEFKMEELEEKIREEFEQWLNVSGLEQIMGVIVNKSLDK